MARTIDGVSSVLKGARLICRIVGKYGTSGLTQRTTPAFTAAVLVFVAACQLFESLDDEPTVIDVTAPLGPEDVSL